MKMFMVLPAFVLDPSKSIPFLSKYCPLINLSNLTRILLLFTEALPIPVVINWTLNVNKTGNYVVFVTAIDESKNCVGEGAADIQVVDELSY